jgi:hypothetical protein
VDTTIDSILQISKLRPREARCHTQEMYKNLNSRFK